MRTVTDDRGAVAALTAVLLGGGVLLGAAALALSTGTRAVALGQAQGAADSAALAVAASCRAGACLPLAGAVYVLADGPAGAAEVVCGSGITSPCPAGCPGPGSLRHWADVQVTAPVETPLPVPGFTNPPVSVCSQATWSRRRNLTWLTG